MNKAKLIIDDVAYEVSYDFNRICDCEAVTGCNLLKALSDLFVVKDDETIVMNPSALQLRGLLFAAIEQNGARPTLQQVGALIRVDTLPRIRTAIADAYSLAVPAKAAKAEEPAKAE